MVAEYGTTANPEAQIGCADVGNSLGITGTPVIDSSTDVAYFVSATDGGTNGATEWFMQAVNVQTGVAPANWPAGGVPIVGHADDDSSTVFNGERETQRPGLVLVNGVVYAAFGSQCDYRSMGGMAYRRVRGQCVDHDDVVKRDEHDIKFERSGRRYLAVRITPGS